MAKRNEYRDLASDLLSAWGIEYDFGRGTKHPYVEMRNGRRRLRLGFPSSPSDRRGILNFETQLRKNVLALGLKAEPKPKPVAAPTPMPEPTPRIVSDHPRPEALRPKTASPEAPPPDAPSGFQTRRFSIHDAQFPRADGETHNAYWKRRYHEDDDYRTYCLDYQRERHRQRREQAGATVKARGSQGRNNRPTDDATEADKRMLPGETRTEYRRRRYQQDPEYREHTRQRVRAWRAGYYDGGSRTAPHMVTTLAFPRLPPLPPFPRLPDEDDAKYRKRRYQEQEEYRERIQEYNRRALARRAALETSSPCDLPIVEPVTTYETPMQDTATATPATDDRDPFAEVRAAFEQKLARALKFRDASTALLDAIAAEPEDAPWKLMAEGLATMLDNESSRLASG